MNLTIKNKAIRTKGGLYCLNDLHKASGGEKKNLPSVWLVNQSAQGLVSILETGNPASKTVITVKGRGQTGTYACKELVYAAAFIQPRPLAL